MAENINQNPSPQPQVQSGLGGGAAANPFEGVQLPNAFNSPAQGTVPQAQNTNAVTNVANQSNTNGNETIVLDIKEDKTKKIEAQEEAAPSILDAINNYLINLSGIKLDEKLLFFQLLGSMVGAGLPIIDALNLLIAQTKNEKFKRVITDMRHQIEDGESLAAAMRNNDDVFDEATCSVIEAGEKSGKLNAILKELVDQYEQLSTLTKKMKSVMTYPVVVIITMFVLTGVVLIFVVPKLEELFGGASNLPLPTRILITGSNIMLSYWYYIIIGIIGSVYAFFKWKKSKVGGKQWAGLLLRAPIFGQILQKMILTRVTRIFGFLISAGVPVVESLKIASHIAESPMYQEKLLLAADDLTKGISIAENLSDDERLFPTMLVNMMAIGEKTASLDTVMGKAADFYKEELERKIDGLSKMMEPIILGIIACGAVFMILAIYLPILKMNDQVVGGF